MGTQRGDPNQAFARGLVELDRELDALGASERPTATLDLIAGLAAGVALAGRPA